MRIKHENKLSFFQELYEDARSKLKEVFEEMEKHAKQYQGDPAIDGSDKEAMVVRNITYELVESQSASDIPPCACTPEMYSEKNERNAKMVEDLIRNLKNKLPFEKMNDLDERYNPVYGGSVFLVEWDNSITTHNTVGDIKATLWSPKHFTGQPYIYDINEMEYCFIEFDTTKEELVRKYGVSFETAEQTTSEEASEDDNIAKVIICYYKDDNDRICQYIWSDDVELLDIEDYYSRKLYICKKCGKRKEICTCEDAKYELQNNEYEELDHDITLSDGSILPFKSTVIKDGEVVMEEVEAQALDESGNVIMDLDEQSGLMMPALIPTMIPKYETTKIPYYVPNKFPIVIRKNISAEDSIFGQSDCKFIRCQQQTVNKIESRILEKLIKGGVFPTVPDDWNGTLDNSVLEKAIKVKPGNYKLFNRLDLMASIQQDIAQSDRVYDHAKRTLGITDSFQGHRDTTANSGVAKQVQVAQSSGRLQSKRVMKNAAYAEIDEIIFQLYLAFADEPRPVVYKDIHGVRHNTFFNRYDFVERDDAGEYYYNDRYLFSIDNTSAVERNRETIWQENRANFTSGAYGDITLPETQLIFWQNMEKAHYPFARDNVERIKEIIKTQQLIAQQQAQIKQQQSLLQSNAQKYDQDVANRAGYEEYLKNFMKGKK